MKDYAKLLVRNRFPVPRRHRESREPIPETVSNPARTPPVPATDTGPNHPSNVYRDLDSWRPNKRSGNTVTAQDIMTDEEFASVKKTGRPSVVEKKKRGVCMTMSVSPEEAEILRRYAASLNMTYSEWARSVLFQHMKRRVPNRPGNPKERKD